LVLVILPGMAPLKLPLVVLV